MHSSGRLAAVIPTIVAAAALATPLPASAACVDSGDNPFKQVEAAPVAFYGTAQKGPLIDGFLASPASLAVSYRLDGATDAPAVEQVTTDRTEGSRVSEALAIEPKQRWMILGTRRPDGVVSTSACTGSWPADWAHRATWRIPGGARHAHSTLSDTRGNPIRTKRLPKLPKGVRTMEVWTSIAARLIHEGKATGLRQREMYNGRINGWDFRKAVSGDRVVIATQYGFWAAEVR